MELQPNKIPDIIINVFFIVCNTKLYTQKLCRKYQLVFGLNSYGQCRQLLEQQYPLLR